MMAGLPIARVKNDTVWRQIKIVFLASALLFLINNVLGFDNALTVGLLPRWQLLVHLHAGSIGWIALSVIAIAIWLFTGDREVSDAYAGRVRALTWYGIFAFGGYIISFGLAFGLGQPFFLLLPIFGLASVLMIYAGAIFTVSQIRRQEVVTTVHLLIMTALLALSLGATMGLLLGLEYTVGFFVPGADRIGSHAGVMDSTLLLAAAAIVEWFVRREPEQRWRWGGLIQAILWGIFPVLTLAGLLGDNLQLLSLGVPLLLLSLIIFMVRIGWRAIATNPFKNSIKRWSFFGAIWLVLWALIFMAVIALYLDDFSAMPAFLPSIFTHALFVGMMTNLLLGVYSVRSHETTRPLAWAETTALWLINLGLLLFFVLRATADSRLGAIVMGTGVLLGVLAMIGRLWATSDEEVAGETVVVGSD